MRMPCCSNWTVRPVSTGLWASIEPQCWEQSPVNNGTGCTQASWLTGHDCWAWLTVCSECSLVTACHLGSSQWPGFICHSYTFLRWRERPCAMTLELLPPAPHQQRGRVGSEDVSCSTCSGDNCLPWAQGTEGWMLARPLGKSYCCLGQNTFSDTMRGLGAGGML